MYVGDMAEESNRSAAVLSLPQDLSNIIEVLSKFQNLGIDVEHLESRHAKKEVKDSVTKEYFIEFKSPASEEVAATLQKELQKIATSLKISPLSNGPSKIPWFPRHISEVGRCCTTLFKSGPDLGADCAAQLDDAEYMERRRIIADNAKNFKFGEKIPYIEYTEAEIKTWGEVFQNQTRLYSTNACKEYNTHFPPLFAACDYREDNIPQLEDVSQYLQRKTGWRLWPVIGWITPRDFLNTLAFRVFPASQFVRHHTSPFYTPEPDICHELMGHAPLFCDPCFAQFSQDLGMASLGISDEWIEKLATLYWYTVEFGMVYEDGKPKAYGAGLLSSNYELNRCCTDIPNRQDMDIETAIATNYPDIGMQPQLFVSQSLQEMRANMIAFSKTIPRDFTLRFDPYTLSMKVLDNEEELRDLASDLAQQMRLLSQTLDKVNIKK